MRQPGAMLVPDQPRRCSIGVTDAVCQRLLSSWFDLSVDCVAFGELHGSAAAALNVVSHRADAVLSADTIHVYMDGSFQPSRSDDVSVPASWSVAVVLAEPDGGFAFGGAVAGPVVEDPRHPHFVGTDAASSLSAELSSVVWALLWSIGTAVDAAKQGRALRFCFHYDCTASGGVAFSLYNCSRHHKLANIVAGLAQVLQGIADVDHRHFMSHDGHPWNELVDSLCDNVAKAPNRLPFDVGVRLATTVVPIHPWATSPSNPEQWAFLCVAPHHVLMQYPVVDWATGEFVLTARDFRPSVGVDGDIIGAKLDSFVEADTGIVPADFIAPLPVQIVSANVLSFKKRSVERSWIRQFHARKCHVVSCQETRDRWSGIKVRDGYIVVASQADPHGSYGCRIMCSTRRPIAKRRNGSLVYFREHDLTVVVSEPRLLIAKVQSVGLQCTIVSAHAPHSLDDGVVNWWKHVLDVLMLYAAPDPLILCIDANIPVPDFVSSHIGGIGSATEHKNFHLFERVLSKCRLFIPSTFPAYSGGECKATFVARGCATVNDYIAVSEFSHVERGCAVVFGDFDSARSSDDHLPVAITVTMPAPQKHGVSKRRVVEYDRHKVVDPICMQRFSALLQLCPAVPFHIDATSHVHVVNEYIRDSAACAFTKSGASKRKEYVSDATFALILQRGRLRARFRSMGRQILYCTVRLCFLAWKPSAAVPPPVLSTARYEQCGLRGGSARHRPSFAACWDLVRGFVPWAICQDRVFCSFELRRLDQLVQQHMHDDYVRYVDNLAIQLQEATQATNSSIMFKILRRFSTPRVKASSGVRGTDGEYHYSYAAARRQFRAYFSKLLEGVPTSLAQLVSEERSHLERSCQQRWETATSVDLVPTVLSLARIMAKLTPFKGVGEDILGNELAKGCPQLFAQIYGPVMLKASLLRDAPMQWRGGQLQEIYKGKGPLADMASYRDVLLGDMAGKVYCRHLRSLAKPFLENIALGTQYGSGIRGSGTDFAHLHMRAIMDYAGTIGASVAFIFIDVVTAFAAICRRVVLPMPEYEGEFYQRLKASGFDDDVIRDVIAGLHDDLWETKGGPPNLLQLIMDMHRRTWVSFEGLSGIVQTRSGSIAGNALGDLVFTIGIRKVFSSVRDAFQRMGLTMELPSDRAHELFGEAFSSTYDGDNKCREISFVDDGVFPVFARAADLTKQVAIATSCINTICARHGLQLNYNKGKSEVLCVFHGSGMVKAKQKLLLDDSGRISFDAGDGTCRHIIASAVYKHLGTQTSICMSMIPEIKTRMAAMRGAFAGLRSRFFRARDISIDKKKHVSKALLLTRGLFQAGAWPELQANEYKRVHVAVMSVFRSFLKDDYLDGEWESDDSLINRHMLLAPMNILRFLRVSLFARIVRDRACHVMLAVAAASGATRAWIDAVGRDFAWMASRSAAFRSLVGAPFSEWTARCLLSPKRFLHEAYSVISASPNNARGEWARCKAERTVGDQCSSVTCGKIFPSKQQMSVHAFREHGVARHIRRFVDTTHCVACMQCFHTRERLICHLAEKSHRCRAVYGLTISPLSDQDFEIVEACGKQQVSVLLKEGWRRAKAQVPVVLCEGPLVQQADMAGIGHATRLKSRF